MLGSRITEELFPFVHYLVHAKRLRAKAASDDPVSGQEYADYPSLSETQLKDRLTEERSRAAALDDKTFKLTLSLSLGLTVLSSTTAYISSHIVLLPISLAITTIIALSLFYTLVAGLLALSALRTLPSYGYGTRLLLEQKTPNTASLAAHLVRQEIMNLIRQVRNEAAYQALRNGLVLLFVALLLFAATMAYQAVLSPTPPVTATTATSVTPIGPSASGPDASSSIPASAPSTVVSGPSAIAASSAAPSASGP